MIGRDCLQNDERPGIRCRALRPQFRGPIRNWPLRRPWALPRPPSGTKPSRYRCLGRRSGHLQEFERICTPRFSLALKALVGAQALDRRGRPFADVDTVENDRAGEEHGGSGSARVAPDLELKLHDDLLSMNVFDDTITP